MEYAKQIKCIRISNIGIRTQLPLKYTPSKSTSLILLISIFILSAGDLESQTSVVCAGGVASFEEYQPILYPKLARRAGLSDHFSYELSIIPGGKFDYKRVKSFPDQSRFPNLFLETVLGAFHGWRFTNLTNERIILRLNIIFELDGEVMGEDDIAKNRIIFDSDGITIRVIATKITPRLAVGTGSDRPMF